MNPSARAEWLIECARNSTENREALSHLEDVQIYSGYAEPGYSDPDSGVICVGNWNDVSRYVDGKCETVDNTMPRLAGLLERMGAELEWCDEWTCCGDCGKIVRMSADSYHWTASYVDVEGDVLCMDCVTNDSSAMEEYLKHMEGDENNAVTLDVDLSEYGYVEVLGSLEHGFHPGQDANPKVIVKKLNDLGVTRIVFKVDSVGQFDMRFSVHVHKDEVAHAVELTEADCMGPSVSEALARGLREAVVEMQKLPDDEGIKYAQINGDSAKVRLVTPEEFIEGIKDV